MSYTALAARAQALIKRKGGTVTFSRGGSAVYDPATDTWSGGTVSPASGPAVQVRSNPMMLLAAQLVITTPVTLIVAAPALGGFIPQPADTFSWGGIAYTVKLVQDVAPDGGQILYKVTGGR